MLYSFCFLLFRNLKVFYLGVLFICLLACQGKTEKTLDAKKDSSPTEQQKDTTLALPIKHQDTIAALTKEEVHIFRSGEVLWNLGRTYYGNRHYSSLMARYNSIVDVDRVKDSTLIKVPPMEILLQSDQLELYPLIPEVTNKMLVARSYFMQHEKTLKDLREDLAHTETLLLPQKVKKEMQLAIATINDAITLLKAYPQDPPSKMIGQLKSLSQNLTRLSEGKHDGVYGYDLDMMHQRWINAVNNGIIWAENQR